MRFLLLAILTLLASCASWVPGTPQFSVETPLGTAYAHSPERASKLVDTWMRMARSIQRRLPGAKHDEQLDIWLMHEQDIPDPFSIGHPMGGVTYSVNGDAWLIQVPDTHKLDWVLAHELTHALLSSEWDPLGGMLEEGLCEWVGSQEDPDLAPVRELQVYMGAAAMFGHTQCGIFFNNSVRQDDGEVKMRWLGEKGTAPDPVWDLDSLRFYLSQSSIAEFSEVRAGIQRMGTVMIYRIIENKGLAYLHQLCKDAKARGEATLRFEDVMLAAGLKPDGSNLHRELVAPLRARSIAKVLHQSGANFGRYIAAEYPRHFPDYDGENFVKYSMGTIRSIEGKNLRLFEFPSVRDSTRRNWPVREHTAEAYAAPYTISW